MEPLHFEASAHYGLAPAQLWTFIADTQRLNRSIGLPSAEFTFEPRADGGSTVTGVYKQFGFFTISRWREHPFEFVRARHYSVLREYDVGPFTRVQGGAELTPDESGTMIRVWADITPRHWLGRLAAQLLVGPQSTSRVLARCRAYEREVLARQGDEGSAARPVVAANMAVYSGPEPEVDERRLDQLTSALIRAGGDENLAGLLRDHLAHAPDDRVASMRAFELADVWGKNRRDTLAAFLRATTVGLLDLRWDVLCPNCRLPKEDVGTLAELSGKVHCDYCQITVDANFDKLVEVRFKPAAAVRDAAVGVYCIGGPQATPHMLAQLELLPDQSVEWELQAPAGIYMVKSPQIAAATLLEIDEDQGDDTAKLVFESARIVPPLVKTRQNLGLRLESQLEVPVLVQLAEQNWADTAATAALVSTMHEFRDLFSSEVLAPGLQVAIERLALLFTDLAGSTAMYERVGQARAFRLVQDHFRVLDGAIRDHHGTMVKTIGDAVMAVFPSTRDAAAAALQMQCGIRELTVAEGVDATRLLKVGIHSGACVAVTLNDKLDYFGTAVNIAARTEHECQGGEITVTAEAWDDEGVIDLIRDGCENVDPHQAVLKGITEPVQLYRVSGIKCPGAPPNPEPRE